jgi:hypothetical protein
MIFSGFSSNVKELLRSLDLAQIKVLFVRVERTTVLIIRSRHPRKNLMSMRQNQMKKILKKTMYMIKMKIMRRSPLPR